MPGDPSQNGNDVLTAVRQHASGLAGELSGPVRRIRVRSGDVAIEVEWQPAGGSPNGAAGHQAAGAAVSDSGGPAPSGEESGTADRAVVVSPMVGTFYCAPKPGADPFVRVGDVVEAEQTVGLVEAMKLMNPVVAEAPGRVVEILAGSGQPVEFGQPLIALEPVT